MFHVRRGMGGHTTHSCDCVTGFEMRENADRQGGRMPRYVPKGIVGALLARKYKNMELLFYKRRRLYFTLAQLYITSRSVALLNKVKYSG
jgi:hypothetical protein